MFAHLIWGTSAEYPGVCTRCARVSLWEEERESNGGRWASGQVTPLASCPDRYLTLCGDTGGAEVHTRAFTRPGCLSLTVRFNSPPCSSLQAGNPNSYTRIRLTCAEPRYFLFCLFLFFVSQLEQNKLLSTGDHVHSPQQHRRTAV